MSRYSEEFREKIVQKMMPPNSMSVAQISRETGISGPTLYTWKNKYQNEGRAVPADPSNPENWSGKDKLAVIIETAALNEQELSEYCRSKGLYVEQIARWKEAAITGNESLEPLTKAERRQWQKDKKRPGDVWCRGIRRADIKGDQCRDGTGHRVAEPTSRSGVPHRLP